MDRFLLFKKAVSNKIILSKIVYLIKRAILRLKRLIFSSIPSTKDGEISALTRVSMFARAPTFTELKNKRSKSYSLNARVLTSQTTHRYTDLHILRNVLAPFQLENDLANVKTNTHSEINWTRRKFRPPTQLYSIFYSYISSEDTFDRTVSALFTPGTSFEYSFFLRLFQVPVAVLE